MAAFTVFRERPEIPGGKACERLLDTENFQEAVNRMMAASTNHGLTWIEPGGTVDPRYHREVSRA